MTEKKKKRPSRADRQLTRQLLNNGSKLGRGPLGTMRLMPDPDNTLHYRRWIDSHSKLTPRVRRTIKMALDAGLSIRRSLELAAVNEGIWKRWLRKGRDGDNLVYRQFYIDVARIFAKREKESLDAIRMAIRGGEKIRETKIVMGSNGTEVTRTVKSRKSDWRAASWSLERLDPKTYGKQAVNDYSNITDPRELASQIVAAVGAMESSITGVQQEEQDEEEEEEV